jgi:formate hydrogenlyase subunit 6/NADH:ubiquinone oxidoreductase subunit I
MVDGRAQMDLKRCIRCYCCHELCPELAIDLKRSWLARRLGGA